MLKLVNKRMNVEQLFFKFCRILVNECNYSSNCKR